MLSRACLQGSHFFLTNLEQAARILCERVHVIFCIVFSAVHAEYDLTVLAVVVITLLGLLQDLVTRGAHLISNHWIKSHRAENFLEFSINRFDSLLTSLLRMSFECALETLREVTVRTFELTLYL